jgi:hypothetical protein
VSRVVLLSLLCAGAVALPSAAADVAPPAGTYTGQTSQGRPITLVVDDAGTVRAPDVGYNFSCSSGDSFSGSTAFADGQSAQIIDNRFTIGDPGNQLRGAFTVTPGAATTVSGSFELTFTDEDDGDSCGTGSVTFTASGPATAPAPAAPAPPPAPPETQPRDYTPGGQFWLAVWQAVAAATRVHTIAVSAPDAAAISIDAAVVKIGPKVAIVTAAPRFGEVSGDWVLRANGADTSVVPPGAQVFMHSATLLGYTSAAGIAKVSTAPLLAGRAEAKAKGAVSVVLRPLSQARRLARTLHRSLQSFRTKKHRNGKVIVLARVTFTPTTGPRVTFLKLAALAL